uniref:Uncharacterized protein n=2 Tax=Oryza sativa subsp. japonica TaxID=39947 RepID=Q2R7A7_ORYSJ|nr:hypothetical protein LOC_Os11g17250 [Oryza sativa Japonica Group]ABA92684.1 hypothetical protein LOC_Os11g17250 [Oryza sativa Japonica Group]
MTRFTYSSEIEPDATQLERKKLIKTMKRFSRSSPDSVLGPMGDPDPTDLINAETERIPFKQTKPDLAQWKLTIHFWPSKLKGYRSWYKRLAAAKRYHWEEIGIA